MSLPFPLCLGIKERPRLSMSRWVLLCMMIFTLMLASFKTTIMASRNEKYTKKLLVIEMQTRTHAFSLRNTVRNTLLRLKYFKRGQVKLYFVLAAPPPEDTESRNKIEEEIKLYKDVIYYRDIIDGWKQVGLKHDRFLKFAYKLGYKFIMKHDDDAAIDFNFLINKLEWLVSIKRHKEYLLIGHILRGTPDRNPESKYYLSYDEFPIDYITLFPLGYGSITTTPLIKMLFENGYTKPCLFMEDVNIGLRAQKYMATKKPDQPPVYYFNLPHSYGTDYIYDLGRTRQEIPPVEFYYLVHHIDEHQLGCIYRVDINGGTSADKYNCLFISS